MSPDPDQDSMRRLRLHRWVLLGGLFFIAMGLMVGIVAVLSAFNVLEAGIRERDWAKLVVAYSCMALFGAFLIVWHAKYRLILADDEIEQIGLFSRRRIRLSEVTKVHWRLLARDVVLWADRSRLRIEIDALSIMDQAAVASFLHERLPPNVHQGWEQARRPLHIVRIEPIHWGRIAGGTLAGAALAIPFLFLAVLIPQIWAVYYLLALLATFYAGHKLGLIAFRNRIQTSNDTLITPAPSFSQSPSRDQTWSR
jgi:hypothetical protein